MWFVRRRVHWLKKKFMEGVPVRSTLVCIGGIGWLYAGAFNVWLVCGVFFFLSFDHFFFSCIYI